MENFFNWLQYAIEKLLEAFDSIKSFFNDYFAEETTAAAE